MARSPRPREFFLDRSLGRHQVAAALRESGWRVRTHHEVYRERDEDVSDAEWLEYCGGQRLPVLTKDRRIRYRPAEIAAIERHAVQVFVLTGGSLQADEQAARFDHRRARIDLECEQPGPFVFAVQANRIVRVFPR